MDTQNESAKKVLVFSSKEYDRASLLEANAEDGYAFTFTEAKLSPETAHLAAGYPAVCNFVTDIANAATLDILVKGGTRFIALRCAGFNNVDLEAAEKLGMCIARVPAYSPYAVSEHSIGLLLTLNRKIHRAHQRVREGNFALGGLLGFDLFGKTAGIIGTGKIGSLVAKTLSAGFGCRVLAHDLNENPELKALGVEYAELDTIFRQSDIISLHCPLMPQTYHLINAESLAKMKERAVIINTSRGALIDTAAAIEALKDGRLGGLGLDVYEEEADLFFEDLSDKVIQDDVFARLLTMPNVLITGHQAYFTREALQNIAATTLGNIKTFFSGAPCGNAVCCNRIRKSERLRK